MGAIVEWIRSVLIIYFLMMVLLYFAAGESYKKFIRFFMGLVLALTVLTPLLRLTRSSSFLTGAISYGSYRQQQQMAQLDSGRMEEQEQQRYAGHYADALERCFLTQAKEQQLVIRDISVTLDAQLSPQSVVIREGLHGDGSRLREYLVSVYGLEEGQVIVE